jgi:hypothetical protein
MKMYAYEIAAPDFQSVGEHSSFHADRLRRALLDNGLTGWTEYRHVGYWGGVAESGTTFVLYTAKPRFALLCELARWAMPGEEAIQVVYTGDVELIES